jgi:hypothetical protein
LTAVADAGFDDEAPQFHLPGRAVAGAALPAGCPQFRRAAPGRLVVGGLHGGLLKGW